MHNEHDDDETQLLSGMGPLPDGVFDSRDPAPGFRERLLEQTSARLRSRRRARRALTLCGLAAVYLLGLGQGLWMLQPRPPAPNLVTEVRETPGPEATPAPAPESPEAESVEALMDPERLAFRLMSLPPLEQSKLLKAAGDRYLTQRNDIEEALCCYRQMLGLLPAGEAQQAQPSDTWLLLILKEGHNREVPHEESNA